MTSPVAVTFTIVVVEVLNSHPSGVLWKAPKIRSFFTETIEDKRDETMLYRLLGTEKKNYLKLFLLRCALINNNDSIYLNTIEITAKLLWSCI